jgi:hypothetical protein
MVVLGVVGQPKLRRMCSMQAPDPRKRLAYEESVRSLQLQSSSLDDLRSRTGILVSALALSASFLGARSLDLYGFTGWNWAALVAFGVAGGACLGILWPRGKWRFASNAKTIIEDVEKGEFPDVDAMYTFYAKSNQEDWEENSKDRLRWLFWCFRIAVLALILQVVFWLAALGVAHAPTTETTTETAKSAPVETVP